MKKWYLLLLTFLLLGYGFHSQSWSDRADVQLNISAHAAVLIDAATGRILYGKNEDQPRLIASLTKIMTAIVAIENGNMNELVKIGPHAVGVEGSSIYLKLGEKIPLKTLLYGLMLRSGNDAAIAIAEHIGGSVEGFVYLMNQKVEHLGLKNTHFTNPHGLDHSEHYSSARDLALVTAYGMKNPIFKEIVGTKEKTVDWPGEEWDRKFYNKNKMLTLYPGADGVKTGFTKRAHRTLVSSATRNGVQLIAVTLDDGDDWKDCMELFDYGFKQYGHSSLINKGKVITTIRNADNAKIDIVTSASFPYGMQLKEKTVILEPVISYPLKTARSENIQVGVARIYDGRRLVGLIPLETKFSKENYIFAQFKTVLTSLFGQEGVL